MIIISAVFYSSIQTITPVEFITKDVEICTNSSKSCLRSTIDRVISTLETRLKNRFPVIHTFAVAWENIFSDIIDSNMLLDDKKL